MKKFFVKALAAIAILSVCASCDKPTPEGPEKATLRSIIAEDDATFSGISNNGKWAVGSAFWSGEEGTAGTINASKWNLETGERIYLVNDEDPSDAFCINNVFTRNHI